MGIGKGSLCLPLHYIYTLYSQHKNYVYYFYTLSEERIVVEIYWNCSYLFEGENLFKYLNM